MKLKLAIIIALAALTVSVVNYFAIKKIVELDTLQTEAIFQIHERLNRTGSRL